SLSRRSLRRIADVQAVRRGPRTRRHRQSARSRICRLCRRAQPRRTLRRFRHPRRLRCEDLQRPRFPRRRRIKTRGVTGLPSMLKTIPLDNPAPRMAPLARLPVFFALDGKRVIVAGGTPAAAWKVELFSAAGAAVDVYAPATSEELLAIA